MSFIECMVNGAQYVVSVLLPSAWSQCLVLIGMDCKGLKGLSWSLRWAHVRGNGIDMHISGPQKFDNLPKAQPPLKSQAMVPPQGAAGWQHKTAPTCEPDNTLHKSTFGVPCPQALSAKSP